MIAFRDGKRVASLFAAALSLLVSLAACAAPSGADPIDGKAATTENASTAGSGERRLGEELLVGEPVFVLNEVEAVLAAD